MNVFALLDCLEKGPEYLAASFNLKSSMDDASLKKRRSPRLHLSHNFALDSLSMIPSERTLKHRP